ncbi:MAG TPA: hypothetical protein VIZ65_08665 [Cellvibrionaceae bacterium]
MQRLLSIFLCLTSAHSFAAGESLISTISAWGPANSANSHANIVQIQLDGKFDKAAFNNGNNACSADFAGIRAEGGQPLSSLAYAAFFSKQPIGVWLNPADKYFDNRCIITGVWLLK